MTCVQSVLDAWALPDSTTTFTLHTIAMVKGTSSVDLIPVSQFSLLVRM